MFGKKKDIEKILLDNFDKCIVLARYKNSDEAITFVNGDIFDLSIFFKELFTQSKEVRAIAEATLGALKIMEELSKEEPKKEKKKKKKNLNLKLKKARSNEG